MTDPVDTAEAPLSRTPARFFFETGFFAAYAEATVKAGNRAPFELTDAVVDHAWDIAGDAHPDRNEFDRYLSRADSADARLAEAEATFRAHFAAEKEATGSPDELAACANSLRQFGADLFPTNRNGQAHFARVLMDSVANTIDAALLTQPAAGSGDGYVGAFYELAALMGIPAQIQAPKVIWQNLMRPRLTALLAPDVSKPQP